MDQAEVKARFRLDRLHLVIKKNTPVRCKLALSLSAQPSAMSHSVVQCVTETHRQPKEKSEKKQEKRSCKDGGVLMFGGSELNFSRDARV